MSTRIPAYLINLRSDFDRLKMMAQQLDRLSLPYQRYEAIRGDNLPAWLIPYFYHADGTLASQLSWGEIGCYASHLDLMRQVSESGSPALILEDDLRISPDFPETLRLMLNADLDWDILRISSTDKSPIVDLKKLNAHYSLVSYPRVPPNTGAYLIRPEGARKFLAWDKPRWRPVDQDLRRVWETEILTIGIFPIPIVQNIMPSSIDSIGGRVLEKKKYLRQITRKDKLKRFSYNLKTIGLPKLIIPYIINSDKRPRKTA